MVDEKNNLDKLNNIVEEISGLSLIDVSTLVDLLKTKLNITDIPFMSAGAPMQAAGGEAGADAASTKDEFSVLLTAFKAEAKIKVLKAFREIKKKIGSEIGLKEAKELIDSPLPLKVCEGVPKKDAEGYLQQLKDVGGEGEIK